MYIVITHQFNRDTSIPSHAIRMITEDPVRALENARSHGLESDPEEDWIQSVLIYEMEVDRGYSLHEFMNLRGESAKYSPLYWRGWIHGKNEYREEISSVLEERTG